MTRYDRKKVRIPNAAQLELFPPQSAWQPDGLPPDLEGRLALLLHAGDSIEHWTLGRGIVQRMDVASAWLDVLLEKYGRRCFGVDSHREQCILEVNGIPFCPTRPLKNSAGPHGNYAWTRAR